jgi:hypothetical protein
VDLFIISGIISKRDKNNKKENIMPMSRKAWIENIKLANNAVYVGNEKGVYTFEATEFSAQGILNHAQSRYPNNRVVLVIIGDSKIVKGSTRYSITRLLNPVKG